MKKYLQIAFWLLAGVYLVAVLGFVSKKQNKELCTSIIVNFKDSAQNQYIDKTDVQEILESDGIQILGNPINNLNLSLIEGKLNKNPYIKHAEVYRKINGELTIDIEQRNPVIRVVNSSNRGFYIGQEGIVMPVSKKLQIRMIIANGKIDYEPDFDTINNIYDKNHNESKEVLILRDLHKLINFINNDPFWEAQIQQIYVTEKGEFELIPLVGEQIIQFGGIERYEEKFRNLDAIYKKGFSSTGWNQYRKINLKYKDQVVCSKSE